MINGELINEIADSKLQHHQRIATHVISLLQSQGISLGDFIRGVADYCCTNNICQDATLLLEEASQKLLEKERK